MIASIFFIFILWKTNFWQDFYMHSFLTTNSIAESNTEETMDLKKIHAIIYHEKNNDLQYEDLRVKEATMQGFIAQDEAWQDLFDFLIRKHDTGIWMKKWTIDQLKEQGEKESDLFAENFETNPKLQQKQKKIEQQLGLFRNGVEFQKRKNGDILTAGLLIQSGIHYDEYEKQLEKTVFTINTINKQLESVLDKACEICTKKQRVPLQICPSACF